MTRGLLVCGICGRLTATLTPEHRCATCHEEWIVLAAPKPAAKRKARECVSCHRLKDGEEFPLNATVTRRLHNMCFPCVEDDKRERERQARRKAEEDQAKEERRRVAATRKEQATKDTGNPDERGRACSECGNRLPWASFTVNGRKFKKCRNCRVETYNRSRAAMSVMMEREFLPAILSLPERETSGPPETEGTRECAHCRSTKSVLSFVLTPGRGDGRDQICRSCRNQIARRRASNAGR